MGEVLNIVTAVSRPGNLFRVRNSIETNSHKFDIKWITIFDDQVPPEADFALFSKRIRIQRIIWKGGRMRFGIMQKNAGIDACEEGFYFLLDDDNILHPSFLKRISEIVDGNPEKKGFAFGQMRWDGYGNIIPTKDTMVTGRIDNSMFVVHTSLIGKTRYDPKFCGYEDGHFFRSLYESSKESFLFVPEYLSYYNYISSNPR